MLLGRDAELKRLDQVLDERQPALVLITCGPQQGKTSLLKELRRRAKEYGYCVLPTDETATEITRQTDEAAFRTAAKACSGVVQAAPDAELAAPSLILVEGYRPRPRFERWFVDTFLAKPAADGPARIVVVAAYPDDAKRLIERADHTIELGCLDRETIEQHLREQSERASFPLNQAELDAYGEALSKQPALIGALERLLELERTGIGGRTC